MAKRSKTSPSFRASGPLPALSTTSTGTPASGGSRSSAVYQPWRQYTAASAAKQLERLNISRTLQNQVPFVAHILRTLAHEAIGNGLSPRSSSANQSFREESTRYFEKWGISKAIDLARMHDFWTAQPLLAHAMMSDGVVYALKRKVQPDDTLALSRPLTDRSFRALQLQFIHRDQIGNATAGFYLANQSDTTWDQGVKFDGYDRPISYRVLTSRNNTLSSDYVERNATEMLRVMEAQTFNQRHGDPWIFTAGQSGFDLMDINALRLTAAKIQATFLGALKTSDGALPQALGGYARKGTVASSDGSETVTDNGLRYLELPGGVNLPVLAEGETLSFFQGRENMPFGEIVRDLWSELCLALGVPPEYVANITDLSSASTRMVLNRVKRFLDRIRRAVRDCYCQPVWEFVIGDAIQRGLLPNVEDWAEVEWLGGGLDPSIDAGRDERAEQEKLKTFTGTRAAYCAAYGLDGAAVGQARIDEILNDVAYGAQRAAAMGLDLPSEAFLPIERLQALKGSTPPVSGTVATTPPDSATRTGGDKKTQSKSK